MAVLNPDPSLPSGAAPIFSDTDAARGDHLRANNNKIWGNFTDLDSRIDANFLRTIYGDNEHGSTLVTDFDAITKSGFYTGYGTATGAPNTSYSWFVLHQNSADGTVSMYQRAIAFNTTLIVYERMKISSTWGAWKLTYSEPMYVLPQTINTADVTLTATPPPTIILSGTLTGNRNFTIPATVGMYRVVNSCTGNYYVYMKTPSGTGVYMAPGDVWDVYCDGTNIDPVCMPSSSREIVGSRTSDQTLTPSTPATANWTVVSGDALGEMSNGVFTAKNKCIIIVTCSLMIVGSGITRAAGSAYKNLTRRMYTNAAAATLNGLNISCSVSMRAGDKFDIRGYFEGSYGAIGSDSRITIKSQ